MRNVHAYHFLYVYDLGFAKVGTGTYIDTDTWLRNLIENRQLDHTSLTIFF